MFAFPLRAAALAAAAIGLSGCAYNGLYSGVSLGYGNGYYGSQYGYGYPGYGYSRLGYGYGYGFDPYWGWNDGFYYPGSGFYVYDSYRRPYRWTDAQRRYWTIRRERALATSTTSQPVTIRDHWGDFDRGKVRRAQRSIERPARVQRSVERPARVERSTVRAERQSARDQRRSETRAERASRRGKSED